MSEGRQQKAVAPERFPSFDSIDPRNVAPAPAPAASTPPRMRASDLPELSSSPPAQAAPPVVIPIPSNATSTTVTRGGAPAPELPSPPESSSKSRVEVFRPDPPAIPRPEQPATASVAAPSPRVYNGPSSGVINWSGRLEKGETVTIAGQLPGVPVMVNLDTKEFAIAEAPSPSNGWNRLVIRSKNKRHTVVQITWTVLSR